MVEKKSQPKQVLEPETGTSNSASSLILQWLTYAFWGWCGIAMIWLSLMVFEYFVMGSGRASLGAEAVAYPVAAVSVLFLIAAVIDWFYSRLEPTHKTGAALVIMVIHAVIFALATIGALITAVFALVNMSLQTGDDSSGAQIVLFAALVCLVVFGALTIRTVFAGRVNRLREFTWAALALAVIGTLVASVAGPIAYANHTKQDRLIEQGLPSIVSDISNYTNTKSKLPASLSDLDVNNNDAKKLITDNLVTYKPNTKPASKATADTKTSFAGADQHYYQLCVTYQSERQDRYNNYGDSGYGGEDEDGYMPYLYSITKHPQGEHCYKLIASGAYYPAEPAKPIDMAL
jgi:hypothetical protein